MGKSTTAHKVVTKSLRELLKEEQEPFLLKVYLSEKGSQHRKSSNEKGSNLSVSNLHFLRASFRLVLNKTQNSVSQHTKRIKDVLNKFISNSVSKISKIKNHDDNNDQEKVSGREICRSYDHEAKVEPDRFPISLIDTSCTESNPDEKWTSLQKDVNQSCTMETCNPRNQEQTSTDRNAEWTWLNDNKQHSPVSVLEDIPSSHTEGSQHDLTTRRESSLSRNNRITSTKKITEDSILSASLWKLFVHSAPTDKHTKELQSEYTKSKRFLQHTKQILFDCVREAVEIEGRRGHDRVDVLGTEELGKIICGKMKIWAKQWGNESNLTKILESDFMDTTQEWFGLEEEKKGMGIYIGDTIFEEIKSEILIELTNK